MRIVHVNLAKGFRGGERQTVVLIRELEKLAQEQVLVCRAGSPMIDELVGHRCQVVSVTKPRLSAIYNSALSTNKETLIHAHEAKASQWAYLYYLKTRTPYIITRRIHKTPSSRFFTKNVYKSALSIIPISSSVSSTMTTYLTKIGAKQNISSVIPSSYANLPVENTSPRLRDQFPDKFLIGHTAALSFAQKGQDVIIEAARTLEHQYPQLKFVLIGDGEDREVLERSARDLGNIAFLGFRTDIGDLLSSLDVFIFPSRHEGLGSSLLDALYFNLPIIASNIPGVTDVIRNEENGLLINPSDPASLRVAIERLYKDSELRNKLIERAGVSIAKFKPEAMAKSYLSHYLSCADWT